NSNEIVRKLEIAVSRIEKTLNKKQHIRYCSFCKSNMHSTQNCRQVRNSNGNANGNGGNGNGDYGNNNNYRGNGNNYGNGSNRNYGNQNENYENRNYRQAPCQICNRSRHLTTQCRSPCRNCGRTGHKTIHCRQPRWTEPLCICCYCPKHAHPETMQRNYSTPIRNLLKSKKKTLWWSKTILNSKINLHSKIKLNDRI
uniref:CCHC-type domain-containing protein n=1 Tax=Romanomermis culicivorax TaxID=13658 RepID=A0A915JV05_ROMCU